MLSPSLEDYLEEIYRFSNKDGFVRTTDVADKLSVSLPSVTKAVKRLSNRGYLEYEPYKAIQLTTKGAKLGKFLVTRNRILQEFVKIIGSNCNQEQEAEAIEHYLSHETVTAIADLVEFFKKHPKVRQEFLDFKINQ